MEENTVNKINALAMIDEIDAGICALDVISTAIMLDDPISAKAISFVIVTIRSQLNAIETIIKEMK